MLRQSTSGVTCRVVTDYNGVEALQRPWGELWDADPEANVFQSYEWGITWVKHYRHWISRLLIILCEYEGRAVGLVPLYVRRCRAWPICLRSVMLLGTGEREEEETFTEYMAPLFRQDWYARCVTEIVATIAQQADVGVVDFQRVRESRLKLISEKIAGYWRVDLQRSVAGTCFSMRANKRVALEQMSRRQRANMLRKIRRANEIGRVMIEVAASEDDRRQMLVELMFLHQRRWINAGQPGVFSCERFRQFHEDISSQLLTRGALILARLRIDNETIAAVYCVGANRVCHFYQGGVDSKRFQSLSPGLLMHLLTAEIAGERGFERYDLMMSASPDYKARIGFAEEELHRYTVHRQSAGPILHTALSTLTRLFNSR